MRFITSVLLSILSISAHSAGHIDYLEVDGSVVYFSTSEGKSHQLNSCVLAENNAMWTISLDSHDGRAMYSLILTAMAKGEDMGITVQTADNCDIAGGFEKAANISLSHLASVPDVPTNDSTANSKALYVYDGDGSKLGRYMGAYGAENDATSMVNWMFLDSENSVQRLGNDHVEYREVEFLAFRQENCTSHRLIPDTGAMDNHKYYLKDYNNGQMLTKYSSNGPYTAKSRFINGECENWLQQGFYGYPSLDSSIDFCGDRICTLREE